MAKEKEDPPADESADVGKVLGRIESALADVLKNQDKTPTHKPDVQTDERIGEIIKRLDKLATPKDPAERATWFDDLFGNWFA